MTDQDWHENAKHLADLLALFTVVGSIVSYLPQIAAGLSIIWYLIRFYEYFSAKLQGRGGKDAAL